MEKIISKIKDEFESFKYFLSDFTIQHKDDTLFNFRNPRLFFFGLGQYIALLSLKKSHNVFWIYIGVMALVNCAIYNYFDIMSHSLTFVLTTTSVGIISKSLYLINAKNT